ncbi:MAG: hypothetical protein KAS32_16480 [Candidatus Peribacteraceae bacterium]|nr:hypothetical protein [Candidatus Peribacteraceae bacterium]
MKRYHTLRTYTAMDLAESDSEKADDTAIGTIGITKSRDYIWLERWTCKGSDTVESMIEMFRQMRICKCSQGFIEKNRAESLLRTIRKVAPTGLYGEYETILPLIAKLRLIAHYTTSKMDRFEQNITPVTQSKKLWIKDNWKDIKAFFELYPAVEHDDLGDVADMILEHGRPPTSDFASAVRTTNPREHTSGDVNEYFARKKYNPYTGVCH